MHRAVEKLKVVPELLLIDGPRFRNKSAIRHQCIVDGDALYASIAAASILAKTYRDDCMQILHEEFPQYHWKKNKGYGTLAHREALREHGMSAYHRKSFHLKPLQARADTDG